MLDMPMRPWFLILGLLPAVAPAPAQTPVDVYDAHGSPLGQVAVPDVPCSPEATERLRVGLALLHNMTYEQARTRFSETVAADPDCLLGYWGAAMTYIHPLWPDRPSSDDLSAGADILETAASRRDATPTEAAYFGPLHGYYRQASERDEAERLSDFAEGWKKAVERFDSDPEIRLFRALSMLAVAQGRPDLVAVHTRAGEMALGVLEEMPRHPGALHYTIHAFDLPELADRAEPAARVYGEVIPENSHALHMTSHIFTRLGRWDQSVSYNRRAVDAALRPPRDNLSLAQMFHASDYLVYALLQRGEDGAARALAAELRTLDGGLPPNPHPAAAYALAAVPSRLVLERQAWTKASRLETRPSASIPWDRHPHLEAIPTFARGLGAARSGDLDAARSGLGRLGQLRERAATLADPYDWATQVRIQELTLEAWIRFVGGDTDAGIERMEEAARLSVAHEKHGVSPGDVLSAPELHGDMLMETERFEEALAAYETALTRSPNRLNSLYGAGRAAEALGAPDKAEAYYRRLVEQVEGAGAPDRVQHAAAFLGGS